MKKMTFVLVALLAVAMFFTACGKKADSSAAADSSKAAAPETITIAFIGNTTGDYAQYGVPVRNAVKMYFDQLNAKGGINGKMVNLLEYDDKADGVESVNALNLAVDKGATAVIGSVLTGATIALSDATYDLNLPQVTASATSPKVTVMDPDAKNIEVKTNVFRTCFLDPFQGEKMAEYASKKVGAKKVAIFYENGSDYSEAIVNGFMSEKDKYGLTVVAREAFAAGDVDYKAQMTNIAASNPDVVLMPIYYSQAGLAITALRALGCNAQVIGGDGFGSVKKYATAADLEGTVYFSGYAAGTPSVEPFEKDYKATFGEDVPNMFAPLAWDASMVMAEGLKAADAAGLKAGSDEFKQKVIDTIKNLNGYEGITGSYTFNETNDPIKSVAIIKLTNGDEIFTEFF
ncbi:MAG: ABC transporter substrate-binding protein [Spirochaetales bacterium]|nr:ABC transporter substrate-binding protein [Spirochaetales bacterium]